MAANKAKKEIQARLKCFIEKANQKDADGLMEYFTENPLVILESAPIFKSREAIRQYAKTDLLQYKRFVADSDFDMFELGDNVALTSYHMKEEDEQRKILSTQNVTALWKNSNSEWLIDRFIYLFRTKSPQQLYQESVQKEIQMKYDSFVTALNNRDADAARLVFTEDGMIVSSMNETAVGQAAIREYLVKGIPKWRLLSSKTVFFELLNDNIAFTNNEVTTTDEQSGEIRRRYRDGQTWTKKQGAGWFLKHIIYTEEPVRQNKPVGVQ